MEKQALAVREQQWYQTITTAKQSGQSIKSWCAENGVPLSSFYSWQRKMRATLLSRQKMSSSKNFRPARRKHLQMFLHESLCRSGMLQLSCQQICPPARSARSSGGSAMLGDIRKVEHIYIACGYTDLRRGIDGLAQIVQNQFSLDSCSNSLFLFCGRRRNRIKALLWKGDGFVLLYKRVEAGCFQWPRTKAAMRSLSWQEFRWLLEGLSVDQPKATKTIERVVL